jgi:MOSC domain-containing protein YiiM
VKNKNKINRDVTGSVHPNAGSCDSAYNNSARHNAVPINSAGASVASTSSTHASSVRNHSTSADNARHSARHSARRNNGAYIISINTSAAKGERKKPVGRAELVPGHGIIGDGHAGRWHRQISLLAAESIEKIKKKGLDVGPGDFAENVTTRGIDLLQLPIGTKLRLGDALVEVTQIGKKCHSRCEIYRQAGDCVMPREGIFARVLEGGLICEGDHVSIVGKGSFDSY